MKLIRSIPVHVDMDDAVGWHFDNKGAFSVKSAYKVHRASEASRQVRGRTGGAEGSGEEWMTFGRSSGVLTAHPK